MTFLRKTTLNGTFQRFLMKKLTFLLSAQNHYIRYVVTSKSIFSEGAFFQILFFADPERYLHADSKNVHDIP